MTQMQDTFRALADPTRRDILAILSDRAQTIGEVAEGFDMTRPAVKKHLSILERGGLITVEVRGRERVNRLSPDGLRPVIDWITSLDIFWDDRLAALKAAIEKDLQ